MNLGIMFNIFSAFSAIYIKHCMFSVFALILFTYLLESQISIYSNKFFHNFHLSETSFTCPGLRASGLAWKMQTKVIHFWQINGFLFNLPLIYHCRLLHLEVLMILAFHRLLLPLLHLNFPLMLLYIPGHVLIWK
jgi:hypothetical protein